jgi:hypothetical protein
VPLTIVAILVLPLACWLLAARTPRGRGTVLLILAVFAVIEIALVEGWIFPGQKFTLLAIFLIATSATLLTGIAMEKARRDLPPFRRAGPRVLAGALLSGTWATLAAALIVFFVFGELAFGKPVDTPSADTVLPVPSNFYVVANVDRGCGASAGPQMVCIREIDLQGSGPTSTAALVESLTGVYGWHLTRATDQSWNGCRTVGSFLDAPTVCAVIQSRPSADVVTLEAAGDW